MQHTSLHGDGFAEFLDKGILLQVCGNALLDDRDSEKRVNIWSLARTLLQAHGDDISERCGVCCWQWCKLTVRDFQADVDPRGF